MVNLPLDIAMMRDHADRIGPGYHIWASFPDQGTGAAHHRYCTFDDMIDWAIAQQRDRRGIFLTVNAMTGRQRLKAEVHQIRAVWRELDIPAPTPLPLAASLVVATSPGKRHEYLICEPTDPLTPLEGDAINTTIARHYDGDPHARDIARVLRLAGTWHYKTEPHLVHIVSTGPRYARCDLVQAFPIPPTRPTTPLPAPVSAGPSSCYETAAITGICHDLAQSTQPGRNAMLNKSAFRLGLLGKSIADATALLHPIAHAIGLDAAETTMTIKSGTAAGLRKRQTDPITTRS